MKLTENAEKVLSKRYYRKDGDGNVLENWQQMLERVSENISAEIGRASCRERV